MSSYFEVVQPSSSVAPPSEALPNVQEDLLRHLSLHCQGLFLPPSTHTRLMDDPASCQHDHTGHRTNVIHAFNGAEDVSFLNSTVNIVGGDVYNNVAAPGHGERLQEISQWLSVIDFATIQSDTLSKRTPGTGQWFLQSRAFIRWFSDVSGVLWLVGMPGSGKTILTSIVIDRLQKFCSLAEGVAILYCYIRHTDHYSTRDILACLVKQLIRYRPSIPSQVEALYGDYYKTGKQLTEEDLLDLFRSVLPMFDRVHLVIDALDEMPEGSRAKLLRKLSSLQLNMLLTSRVVDLGRDLLQQPTLFSIEAHHTEKDIELFIHTAIGERANIAPVLQGDGDLLSLIYSRIKERSRGMFLAAALHIEALSDCITKNELRKAAESLPTSTEDMYASTLRRIEAQSPKYASLATRTIIWLAHARRSMEIAELQHALATSYTRASFDANDITPEELLVSSCCGLITVEKRSRIVRLAHYTAYDFFKTLTYENFASPHSLIAKSCIAYLSAFNFGKEDILSWDQLDEFYKKGCLLSYAHMYWGFHARECYEEIDPSKAASDFVSQCRRYPFPEGSLIVLGEPCHVGAYYGLKGVFRLSEKPYNRRTSNDRTPLILASQQGHEAIVQLILSSKKSNINSQDAIGNTALIEASKNGHENIVKLLLAERDIEVNARTISGDTALMMASKNGYRTIVESLLAYERVSLWNQLGVRHSHQRVDVNMRNANGNTPLMLACQTGQTECVELLLALEGVDVNMQNSHSFTALMLAATNGHHQLVCRLLSHHEINITTSNNSGDTALILASRNGHKAAAELLLNAPQVQVNSANRVGQTALITACENGHRSVVELLLSHNEVDVNFNHGTTALTEATQRDYKEIVKIILSHSDVDINALGKYGMTALMLSCAYNRKDIFSLLFDRPEIAVNATDESGTTAFSWAEDIDLIGRLISHPGFHADGQDAAPLIRACASNHEKAVNLLLSRRIINVNATDKNHRTALFHSSSKGQEEIVRLLLSQPDIDINASDEDDNTALTKACQEGQEGIAELLLSQTDIQVNRSNKSWETALTLACQKRLRNVAKLLLLRKELLYNWANTAGDSALTLACKKGLVGVVDQLVKHHDLLINHRTNSGETALTLACHANHRVIVRLLLKHKRIDVNQKNISGDTPLTLACRRGFQGTVKQLIVHQKTAVNKENGAGQTALRIAYEIGHKGIIQLLLSHPDIIIGSGRMLENRILNPGPLSHRSKNSDSSAGASISTDEFGVPL